MLEDCSLRNIGTGNETRKTPKKRGKDLTQKPKERQISAYVKWKQSPKSGKLESAQRQSKMQLKIFGKCIRGGGGGETESSSAHSSPASLSSCTN